MLREKIITYFFKSIDNDRQKNLCKILCKKSNKTMTNFAISSWINMAKDDLDVAQTDHISSFIRSYHAQQAIEKMLKAAFVVSIGEFDEQNPGWVLPKNVDFPKTHDLSMLWNKIVKFGVNDFHPLDKKQKDLMDSISKCAVKYRYPYYKEKVGTQVSFPDVDVNLVIEFANQMFNDLYDYICKNGV